MQINKAPADWSNTIDTVHGKYCRVKYIFQHNHVTTGLCVTFGGAAGWKSRQLNPTAQSTAELRKHEWENGHFRGAQGMAWFGFCLLASVFCLFSVCFVNGLVFDGRNNAMEEC